MVHPGRAEAGATVEPWGGGGPYRSRGDRVPDGRTGLSGPGGRNVSVARRADGALAGCGPGQAASNVDVCGCGGAAARVAVGVAVRRRVFGCAPAAANHAGPVSVAARSGR